MKNQLHPLRTLFVSLCTLLAATASTASEPSALDRATAAFKAGDVAGAEALVTPLATATPPDAAALNLLSQLRIAQKRNKEAVEAAEAATKAEPTNATHFAQLGMAIGARMGEVGFMQMAMMSGRMKGAFEQAVQLDPKNLNALVGLSRYYSNAPEIAGGSLTKAAEYAERVKAELPFLGEAELGRIAEKKGDLTAALQHFEASLKLRPESPGTLVAAGQVLAKLGRPDEARARFNAALQLNPAHEGAKRALAALDAPAPKPSS
jgi:tetratricopeptide (TPR) repeat protein